MSNLHTIRFQCSIPYIGKKFNLITIPTCATPSIRNGIYFFLICIYLSRFVSSVFEIVRFTIGSIHFIEVLIENMSKYICTFVWNQSSTVSINICASKQIVTRGNKHTFIINFCGWKSNVKYFPGKNSKSITYCSNKYSIESLKLCIVRISCLFVWIFILFHLRMNR